MTDLFDDAIDKFATHDGDYPDNLLCQWDVSARSAACLVILTITQDMSKDVRARPEDRIRIYNGFIREENGGSEESAELLRDYPGADEEENTSRNRFWRVRSEGPRMGISFRSDMYGSAKMPHFKVRQSE